MNVRAPKLRALENAFTSPNHNGNLYNQENDWPVKDPSVIEDKKPVSIDAKRLARTKIGDTVQYPNGEGTVVERSGFNIKVFNADTNITEYVPIGLTHFQDDVIDNIELKMWDMMLTDARNSVLNKAKVDPKVFINRDWFDLPEVLRKVIKDQANLFTGGVSHGGMSGREPGISRDAESQSYRDLINPPHVKRPVDEEGAEGVRKLHDVTKPIRGHSWKYWDEKLQSEYPDKDQRGAVIGAMESKEKAEQDLAAITGEGKDGVKEEKKDEHSTDAAVVGSGKKEPHSKIIVEEKSDEEHGMYGGISTDTEPLDAKGPYEERPLQDPNRAEEIIDEGSTGLTDVRERKDPREPKSQIGYNQKADKCKICDGDHKTDEHVEKEGLTTASVGVQNPIYGNDKKRKSELQMRNKYNTRYGVRYGVTQAEFDEQTKQT